jgi:hypothetical protein
MASSGEQHHQSNQYTATRIRNENTLFGADFLVHNAHEVPLKDASDSANHGDDHQE